MADPQKVDLALKDLRTAYLKWISFFEMGSRGLIAYREHRERTDQAALDVNSAQLRAWQAGAMNADLVNAALGLPVSILPISSAEDEKGFYTLREVADIVKRDPTYLQKLIYQGKIRAPLRKLSGGRRFCITPQELRRLRGLFDQPADLLTPSQAAKLCGVHRRTAWRWAQEGRIEQTKRNGHVMFHRYEIERLAEKRAKIARERTASAVTNPTAKRKV